jgi:hypothetical protein
VLEKIWDKITWAVAYALLPITYPVYWYTDRKLQKKIDLERKEQEKIRSRNLLR